MTEQLPNMENVLKRSSSPVLEEQSLSIDPTWSGSNTYPNPRRDLDIRIAKILGLTVVSNVSEVDGRTWWRVILPGGSSHGNGWPSEKLAWLHVPFYSAIPIEWYSLFEVIRRKGWAFLLNSKPEQQFECWIRRDISPLEDMHSFPDPFRDDFGMGDTLGTAICEAFVCAIREDEARLKGKPAADSPLSSSDSREKPEVCQL